MTNFKPFIKTYYTAEEFQKRVSIITALLNFVTDGCDLPYGKDRHNSTTDSFVDAVSAKLMLNFQLLSPIPKFCKQEKIEALSDLFDVFDKFLPKIDKTPITIPYMNRYVLPTFEQDFINRFGEKYEIVHMVQDGKTLQDAYNIAKFNFYNAKTRVDMLFVIIHLLKLNENEHRQLKDFDVIISILSGRANKFMLQMMTFGTLLGGDFAKSSTKAVLEDRFVNPEAGGIQFSLIEYLEENGNCPGFWKADRESNFRDELTDCYKKIIAK